MGESLNALLAVVFGLLIWGRWRYDLVAFVALLVAVLTGLVPTSRAFAGFGHPATIIIAIVLIVSRGLSNSGVIEMLARHVITGGRSLRAHVGIMAVLAAALSAVMNNTATAVIAAPIAIELATRLGVNPDPYITNQDHRGAVDPRIASRLHSQPPNHPEHRLIGKTLAHYDVIALLGRGGMGEVFRARDTKLDRDVAIKLLPPQFSQDPERLARFEREARTLASVQHPNVASIYGFEHVAEHRFLVMELAEGEDLSTRLSRGAIDTTEALRIARQIALGLAAAHDKGIIHRDLKPANVMLGSDGKVKLLDFGLARAYENSGTAEDLANSPTITSAMTQAGVILGTAAYMSPEQARGRPIDRRSDVWALGAVLFEMLTAKKPFDGEVISDVIARILERDPPWEELGADCHPLLRRLLERCMAKNQEDRFHDVADVRIEIEGILADPSGESFGFMPAGLDPNASSQRNGATGTPGWVLVLPWVLLAAFAIAMASMWFGSQEAPRKPIEFAITAPDGYELREFELASNGTAIVFSAIDRAGTSSFWIRDFDNADPRQLPGTERAMFPFWSPDSRSIAFFADGKLKRMDLATGSLQIIADAPNGRGGAWNEDGTILYTPEGDGVLLRVSALGGTPEPVTTLQEPEISHRFPHFLPDRTRFVFAAHGANSNPRRRYLSDGSNATPLRLPDGMSEAYPAGNHLLYVRQGTVVAHEFGSGYNELVGEPYPLFSGISDTYPRTGNSAFSVSDEGTLAYLQTDRVPTNFQWADRAGRALQSVAEENYYSTPALSHDGTRVVFRVGSVETGGSVRTLDLGRGTQSLVAELNQFNAQAVVWTPDDAGVIYSEGGLLYRHDIAGRKRVLVLDTTLPVDGQTCMGPRTLSIAGGGSMMIFDGWQSDSDYDLWRLDLREGALPVRLVQASRTQGHPSISPDEKWVAYHSNESGRNEVYLRSSGPGSQRWIVSNDGGSAPEWNEDGSELYFLSSEDVLYAVSIDGAGAVPQIGRPVGLFQPPLGPVDQMEDSSSSPSLIGVLGDRFLFHVPTGGLPTRSIRVVLDWERLLER